MDYKKMSEELKIPVEKCQQIYEALENKKDIRATEGVQPFFKEKSINIADLQVGMILQGVVNNVAEFGAFIDIGVHQDGLLHKSQISNRFVKNIHDVIKVGQRVNVEVTEVKEVNGKTRISFSTKNTDKL